MKLLCLSLILVLSLGSLVSADLVAYWPFDTDPNNAVDNPAFDGVVIGDRVSFSGENVAVGTGALKIDDNTISGANFVKIENSPFVGIETKFSIAGWFLLKDISNDGTDARAFICETNNNIVSLGCQSATGEVGEWYMVGTPGWNDTSGPLITADPNAWRHFALVYNSEDGYGRFYYDGQLRDDVTGTPGVGLNATTYLNIGDFRDGNGGRNFDGYIDDMAVFDRALTGDQVLALYNKTHTPDTVEELLDLQATQPSPEDGIAHVNGGKLLSWVAPQDVTSPVYNVYLSTDPDMVNDVITLETDFAGTSTALPSVLTDATTYYWRVDIVGGEQGETWSFSTPDGLVAYWSFDTAADLTNVQGNTDFDGVAIGNAVVSADDVKVGTGALKIDDNTTTSNYVDITSAPIVVAQGVYSVVGWYKYSDISSNGSDSRNFVFETVPSYAASFGIRNDVDTLNKRAQYYAYTQVGTVYTPYFNDPASGPVVDDGNWHHVAVVWNGLTDTISYYHDGSLFEAVSVGADVELVASDGFHIGSHRAGDGARNYDGYIDDMAIYDVELLPAQVSALFNGVRTPLDVLEELQLTATNPSPTTGGPVAFDGQLSWQDPPDITAPLYNVYFSTDPNMVNDVTTLAEDLDGTSVDLPDGLEYETTYYWRVDSVDGASIYTGDIWSVVTPREPTGLVAWWPFDDDPNNAQGNPDFDGVVIGSRVSFSGENVAVGTGALKIDDDTISGAHFVHIDNSPFTGIETKFSLTGWFLLKDISGDGTDARAFICETEGYEVSVGCQSATGEVGEWYMRGSPGWQDTSGPIVDDPNTWRHFALVYNAEEGYGRFYYDGQLRDDLTGTPGSGLLATEYLNIGNHRAGDGGRNFDGYIDDMAVFDKALTDEQVLALYDKTHTPETILSELADTKATRLVPADGMAHVNGGTLLSWMAPGELEDPAYNVYLSTDPAMTNDVITLATNLDATSIALPSVLPAATKYYWRVDTVGGRQSEVLSFTTIEGLVAHWTFDIADDMANIQGNTDFDGIVIGNAVVSADDVKVGTGALKIDDDTASSNYVDIAAAPILGAQAVYSIVGWYKYSDISLDGSDSRNFIFETAPNHAASFGIRDDGEDPVNKRAQYYVMAVGDEFNSDTATGPIVDDGNWHHVALVWDNLTDNMIKYYHDGSLVGSEPVGAELDLAFTDGLHIGSHRIGDGTRNWDGYIDDIAIYDKALSSYQVRQLVTNPAVNCGNVLEVRKYWADFNDSGVVELDDLRNFADKWLTDDAEVDYDGSGTVDFSDFGVFGDSWQLVE